MFDFLEMRVSRLCRGLLVAFGVLSLALGALSVGAGVQAQSSGPPICGVGSVHIPQCTEGPAEMLVEPLVPGENIDCIDSAGYKVQISGQRCGPSSQPAEVRVTCADGSITTDGVPFGASFNFTVTHSSGEFCLCQDAGGVDSVEVNGLFGTELKNLESVVTCCDCDDEVPPPPVPEQCQNVVESVAGCSNLHSIVGGLTPSDCDDSAGYDVRVGGYGCGILESTMSILITCEEGLPETDSVLVPRSGFFENTTECACAGKGGVAEVRLSGAGITRADGVFAEVTCCDCDYVPPNPLPCCDCPGVTGPCDAGCSCQ